MFLSWGCVSPDKLTLPWKDREGENTLGDISAELRLAFLQQQPLVL